MSKPTDEQPSHAHLVLDPKPLQRRVQAWHALAAMRAKCAQPSLQLFAGAVPSEAAHASEHVPLHLLTPHPSHMD